MKAVVRVNNVTHSHEEGNIFKLNI